MKKSLVPLASLVLLAPLVLAATAAAASGYDSEGRRDPFVAPAAASDDAVAWDSVRPTAILRTDAGAVAMLVGGPAGVGVAVREGGSLGEARVVSIDEARGRVVLHVPNASLRGFSAVVLALRER